MRTDLPPEVQKIFFDFHWDRAKLFAVEAEVQEIPVSSLEWQLDLPIWQREPEQTIFDLHPREVLEHPAAFPDHARRIDEADFSYSLILMKNLRDQWVIMDGYHRLARAWREKKETLLGKMLPRSVIPLIRRV